MQSGAYNRLIAGILGNLELLNQREHLHAWV